MLLRQIFQVASSCPIEALYIELGWYHFKGQKNKISTSQEKKLRCCPWIKSKSKSSFKTLVKKKTKEFAANTLKQVKIGHSKMSNLEYKDLEMQVYLTDETIIKQERYTDSEIEWQDSGKISRGVDPTNCAQYANNQF